MMLLDGVPMTRVNYLNLAYMGQVPKRLSAEEEEASVPVRKKPV